jgi:hypothetical protein
MEHKPQPFNPEALRIARELVDNKAELPDILAKMAIEVIEVRNHYKKLLHEKTAELRALVREGAQKMDTLKEMGLTAIQQMEKNHNDVVERIRQAQPELQDCEFKFDLEDGTYTIYGPRGTAIDDDEEEEKKEPEPELNEATAATKKMVEDLMARIGRKAT